MAPEFSDDITVGWKDFAEMLRRELHASEDNGHRATLLHSLARVFEEKLNNPDEAYKCLDSASELNANDPSIDWDLWRAAARRGPECRLVALERLIQSLERPDDIVAGKLWYAKLLRFHADDETRSQEVVEEAAKMNPEHRGLLWARAEFAAGKGDRRTLSNSFMRLAQLTSDSALRAALLVEVAHLELEAVASNSRLSALLSEALEEPGADWPVVADVLYISFKMNNWSLYAKALERLARVAMTEEPEEDERYPAGHAFAGFERGPAHAAACWWEISLVRERHLESPEGALEALENVLEIVGGHPFLDVEKARLLEACGKPLEALEALPPGGSDVLRVQLALQAGRRDLAKKYEENEEPFSDSVFGELLLYASGAREGIVPPTGSSVDVLSQWLQTNLFHPERYNIAKQLLAKGDDSPVVRLVLSERAGENKNWPTELKNTQNRNEQWFLGVDALLGITKKEIGERGPLFLKWAESTNTPNLKAALISVAARIEEYQGQDKRKALGLHKRAEKLDPRASVHTVETLRLMHSLGLWTELSERLQAKAESIEDSVLARIASYERALIHEFALDDPLEAVDIVTGLIDGDSEDVAASWFMVRLAFHLENWRLAADELDKLVLLCPEESSRIELLIGELQLFAIGNTDDALTNFQNASMSDDPGIAQTARIYSLYVHYQNGDTESLVDGLGEEVRLGGENESSSGTTSWTPELFEMTRATRGVVETRALLEQINLEGPRGDLWSMMTKMDAEHLSEAGSSVGKMAHDIKDTRIASSCRTAAALLNRSENENFSEFTETDLSFDEALWYLSERCVHHDDKDFLEKLCEARATSSEDVDQLVWADAVLCQAEALESKDEYEKALSLLDEALDRVGDHPGILESKARIARKAEEWAQLADTHGRLAGFYASENEKANQLSEAAFVLFKKIGDDQGAQNICEEALKRVPAHSEANEVLTQILKRRGDEKSVSELLDKRIAEAGDSIELADLYETKADQLLAMDDWAGTIEALDNLIVLEPNRLSAYLTKIEVLANMDKWQEVVAIMGEYVARCDDTEEIRRTSWRAADLIVLELQDIGWAIEWLEKLVEKGDTDPGTQRRIVDNAKKMEDYEKAFEALTRLLELVDEREQKIKVRLELAEIYLEHLFDDQAAADMIDEILKESPADIPTLRFALTFRDKQQCNMMLLRAKNFVRERLRHTPTDTDLIIQLKGLAEFGEETALIHLSDDILVLLGAGGREPGSDDGVPSVVLDEDAKQRYLKHFEELTIPTSVAKIALETAAKALPPRKNLPTLGKAKRVNHKSSDSIDQWIASWGNLIGEKKIDVYKSGNDPRGSFAVAGNVPSVAISEGVSFPLIAKYRFFLARNIFWSAKGLGGFEIGDTDGLTKWIIALAASVLEETQDHLFSADIELVNRVKKALSRKQKKALRALSHHLLNENRQSLESWAQATMYSADRLGFLAVTRLTSVIPHIVEEVSGKEGLADFKEDPKETISKIPRCRELLKFVLSDEYLAVLELIGMGAPSGGGDR